MLREEKFAGLLYEKDFQKLQEQIKDCFIKEGGPGALPTRRKDQQVLAIIAPHSRYSYSGSCAAWGYKELAENKFPQTYVIIAPSSTGEEGILTTDMSWKTPFGIIRSDLNLVSQLVKEGIAIRHNNSFFDEATIEVQLPFLQFISMQEKDNLKIVPIIVSTKNLEKIEKLALTLSEIENIILICSSDLTHLGPKYNYEPFVFNKQKEFETLEKNSREYLSEVNYTGFQEYSLKNKNNFFGCLPSLLVTLKYCQEKNAKGKVLQYTASGNLNEEENVVGYSSIVFF